MTVHPTPQMKVLFRADGSAAIGVGHLVRCGALARELCERECEVHLVVGASPAPPQWALDLFPGRIHQLVPSSPLHEDDGEPLAHAGWLPGSQADDAAQVIDIINRHLDQMVDWIVVDHYALDARWHRSLSGHCRRLLAIDDLADRNLEVHRVLDQNRDPSIAFQEYEPYVDSEVMIMAGPTWALLRNEFRDTRSSNWSAPHDPPRLLVVMGGSDPKGLTAKVIESFAKISRPIELVAVVGDPAQAEDLRARGDLLGLVLDVRVAESNMASLMASVDFAISASGSTVWELCCMGVPMALIAEEVNQAAVVAQAVHAGAAVQVSSLDGEEIREVLDTMMRDSTRLKLMAGAGQALVDGEGAGRVCDIMLAE